MGLMDKVTAAFTDLTGYEIVPEGVPQLLEAHVAEGRVLQKELDLLGYNVLEHMAGAPSQELRREHRMLQVRRARMAWLNDPQIGSTVDLLNDFVFGRGMPKPKAKDEQVQEVIDAFWADLDNRRVLTTFEAQMGLGTDVTIQANLFVLLFDGGDDGKVKLGLLNHDTVEDAVRNPDNRLKVQWYTAKDKRVEWDFKADRVKTDEASDAGKEQKKSTYYQNWEYAEELDQFEEDGGDAKETKYAQPEKSRIGEGLVYHIATNRSSEMVFGAPELQRVIRWASAYNDFMKARLDIMAASAAYVMKRKVKGTPNQVSKLATKALTRRSDLAGFDASTGKDTLTGETYAPPRPGSVLTENEEVEHEPFTIKTDAASAQTDGQMIRAQVSAGTRFPQAYYGDAQNSSLATATSLELPILKMVESRQELFESLVRWVIDRVIDRAVDKKIISKELEDEELETELEGQQGWYRFATKDGGYELREGRIVIDEAGDKKVVAKYGRVYRPGDKHIIIEAHEDQAEDEEVTERDLDYEFSLPNPLKRMLNDLVNSVSNVAKTFDPNNTNVDLSRVLLTIVMQDGFEVEDPASIVDMVFPEGYVDPATQAQQQAQGQPGEGGEEPNPFGPEAAQPGGFDPANPAGGPQQASAAENNPYPFAQGLLGETRFSELPEDLQSAVRGRQADAEREFDADVGDVADSQLSDLLLARSDSNGSRNGKA